MPAQSPPVDDLLGARLKALGEGIRAERVRQKLSAATTAEAAGMSRATLHRIERGEPSVTLGAYLNAIDALGLVLELRDPRAEPPPNPVAVLPARIRLSDFPQLQALAWQLHGVDELSAQEALALYERNWRHVIPAQLVPAEQALLKALQTHLGGGRLLV